MRFSLVLALTLALIGCNKQNRGTAPAAAPPALTSRESPAHAKPARLSQTGIAALRQSTAVLEKLTTIGSDGFPDAVLSRAKCLLVLPGVYAKADAQALGTMSCRSGNSWSDPAFVKFTGVIVTATSVGKSRPTMGNSDLLIFIMSDGGKEAVLGRSVDFGSQVTVAAGPVNKAGAIVADVELKAGDALAYLHSNRQLRGVPVRSGRMQLNSEVGKQVFGAAPPKAILTGNAARASATQPFNIMVNSLFYMIRPAGIIVHHSVLVPDPANAAQELDKFHSKRGFSIYCFGREYHVAYHYLILPDGTIQPGRPERCQGAHTRGYNSYLGIALVGDFSTEDNPQGKKGQMAPSQGQLRSLLEITRRLRERYDIPLHRIVRHSDISRTYCPGDRFLFTRFLADLQRSGPGGL